MIVFAAIAVFHVFVFILLTRVWNSIQVFRPGIHSSKRLSVLIPVRNESRHLSSLLEDLENQDYDPVLYEVIVIDDHSTDDTLEKALAFQKKSTNDIKVLSLEETCGKKAAASRGVEEATGEIILCTDGDCRVPPTWISTYAAFFQRHHPQMVSGPVKMVGNGAFDIYQALDFSSLIAFGAATLQKGFPSTCNGANMAYLKSAFEVVNGYEGNDTVPSGDDEFLLQKIHMAFPGEVHFVKSKAVMVSTYPKGNLSGFIQQRLRWLSKWRLHSSWWLKIASVYAFLDFISIFVMVWGAAAGWWSIWPVLALTGVRWLAEAWYLSAASHFLEIGKCRLYFPVLSFVYPFYVLLLGFGSIFGKYSWKGRNYS